MKSTATLAVTIMILLGLGATLAEGATPRSEIVFQDHKGRQEAELAGTLRAREVVVDVAGLHQLGKAAIGEGGLTMHLDLDLFEDFRLTAVIESVTPGFRGTTAWVGTVEGMEESRVIMVTGDVLLGEIRLPGSVYAIHHVQDSVHLIRQVDPLADVDDWPGEDFLAFGRSLSEEESARIKVDNLRVDPVQKNSVIDLLVVYTPNARGDFPQEEQEPGGQPFRIDHIDEFIELGRSKTNAAFANSGVSATLNVVHAAEIDHQLQDFSFGDDLWALKDGTGVFDIVHDLRETYRADLVHMLVGDANNPCGRAWLLMEGTGFPMDDLAFSISSVYNVLNPAEMDCVTNHTFTHEIGHTLGCGHEIGDGDDSGYWTYSHGLRHADDLPYFRTMMAYRGPYSHMTNTVKLHFSNPSILYCEGGYCAVTGDPSIRDNARTINQTRGMVSTHRTGDIRWTEMRVVHDGVTIDALDEVVIEAAPEDLPITETFSVCNDGGHPLVIENYHDLLAGIGFSVPNNPDPMWHTVAPGACADFDAVFDIPSPVPGSYPAAVTVLSNDLDFQGSRYFFYITVELGSPEIRLVQVWDGQEVPNSGTVTFPRQSADRLPISRQFDICNDGHEVLQIDNPDDLVSGLGFSQIRRDAGGPPVSPEVTPGECTGFRARFNTLNEGQYEGAITIHNNDGDENPYYVTLAATVDPPQPAALRINGYPSGSAFDFGDVPESFLCNTVTGAGLPLTNDGPGWLRILNPGTLVSGCGFAQSSTAPWRLEPGSWVHLGVSFPESANGECVPPGYYEGTLTIDSLNGTVDPYVVNLTGRQLGPDPDVTGYADGDSYTFPSVPVYTLPTSKLFSLCNAGTTGLTVEGISTSGSPFTIIVQPASPVAPGQCTSFRVRFNTATPGTYSGSVNIDVNLPTELPESTYTIALSATATQTGFMTYVFQPTDDAYTRQDMPYQNYGSEQFLRVRTAAGAGRHTYLKFDVDGLPADTEVRTAKLRVRTKGQDIPEVGVWHVTDPVFNSSWREETLNYDNASLIAEPISLDHYLAANSWHEFNVKSVVNSKGIYTIGLATNMNNDDLDFSSKELPGEAPELVVEVIYVR